MKNFPVAFRNETCIASILLVIWITDNLSLGEEWGSPESRVGDVETGNQEMVNKSRERLTQLVHSTVLCKLAVAAVCSAAKVWVKVQRKRSPCTSFPIKTKRYSICISDLFIFLQNPVMNFNKVQKQAGSHFTQLSASSTFQLC